MIIKDLNKLHNICLEYKKNNKKIVWTNGCYDLLHPGHIKTFKKCRELGNIVIVGVNGDMSSYWITKRGKSINDERFRSLLLDSIKYIDYVVIFNEDTPLEILKLIKPDVLLKGGDYKVEDVVGAKEILGYYPKVIIEPLLKGYSTTKIIKKILIHKN